MGVNMGHHKFLVHQIVTLEQVGETRVVVDHHLVDARQTISVTFRKLLKLHAKYQWGYRCGKPAYAATSLIS
jgi:hypothetical protein